MAPRDVALIADIGGTHARFAVILPDGVLAHTQIIAGGDFKNISDVCRHYLISLPDDVTITRAAWAVAGPVINGLHTITNRGWSFAVDAIKREFQWDAFTVINDFAALALAVPHLRDTDKVLIKPGHAETDAPCAVVGPGTGLGVAGLVPVADGTWHVLPGEGGHVILPATSKTEANIIDILQDEFGVVVAERVLSGQGLLNLYRAMAKVGHHPIQTYETPEQLGAAALAETDPLAIATLAQFCRFLGNVAGNAALTYGARGGVYLAGGILPHMVTALQNSDFAAYFTSKGVVSPYLDAIPVWLVTHPLPAFVGLQFFLETHFSAKPKGNRKI